MNSGGEALFLEGDEADSLHLVRSGSVAVLKTHNGEEVPLAYVAAANTWGKWGSLAATCEPQPPALRFEPKPYRLTPIPLDSSLKLSPTLEQSLTEEMSQRLRQNIKVEAQSEASTTLDFLLSQGLGEATDVLLIDKALCAVAITVRSPVLRLTAGHQD